MKSFREYCNLKEVLSPAQIQPVGGLMATAGQQAIQLANDERLDPQSKSQASATLRQIQSLTTSLNNRLKVALARSQQQQKQAANTTQVPPQVGTQMQQAVGTQVQPAPAATQQ
jgi:hypothetical protein